MTEINDIDRRVLDALDGRDRLKALLDAKGLQVRDFAKKNNLWVQEVSMCLSGKREYPEIRDALAKELDLTREVVDRLIDEGKADAGEDAGGKERAA